VAAFESSTWVGGVTFPLAAAAIGLAMLATIGAGQRLPFVSCAAIAAVFAAGLALPLLYDQYAAAAMRGAGSAIAAAPHAVLGEAFPEPIREILNLPAYWLLFLFVEFPAFYPAGVTMMALLLRDRNLAQDRKLAMTAFAVLTVVSLGVGWLLVSTLGDNNDLGWRGALPAVMLLIVFASAGLSHWLSSPRWLGAVAALCAVALGVPDGLATVYRNVVTQAQPSVKIFAATPAMWQAVRRHSGESDRVANNPLFLRDMTPWPVNISWALLSNRRSCYAGRELALPFASLTKERREEIDAQFIRIFEGQTRPDDLRELTARYGCRVAVVTAQDGAWSRDPFASDPLFRLVEQDPAAWRIYKADAAGQR
jgi:hypothetical protein